MIAANRRRRRILRDRRRGWETDLGDPWLFPLSGFQLYMTMRYMLDPALRAEALERAQLIRRIFEAGPLQPPPTPARDAREEAAERPAPAGTAG